MCFILCLLWLSHLQILGADPTPLAIGSTAPDFALPGTDGKTSKFSQPNLYLFTKGHFSIIRIEGDKPRSTDNWTTMTQEQVVDTFIKQFTASGGTYEMKGDTLTMKTTIAKSPGFMARANWIAYTAKIDGQTMTLTGTATNEGPIKNPQIMTLTRLD